MFFLSGSRVCFAFSLVLFLNRKFLAGVGLFDRTARGLFSWALGFRQTANPCACVVSNTMNPYLSISHLPALVPSDIAAAGGM